MYTVTHPDHLILRRLALRYFKHDKRTPFNLSGEEARIWWQRWAPMNGDVYYETIRKEEKARSRSAFLRPQYNFFETRPGAKPYLQLKKEFKR